MPPTAGVGSPLPETLYQCSQTTPTSVCYRAVTQWSVVYSIKQNSLNQDYYSVCSNSPSSLWILTVACGGAILTLPTAKTSLRLPRKDLTSSVRLSLMMGTETLNSVAALLKLSCLVTLV